MQSNFPKRSDAVFLSREIRPDDLNRIYIVVPRDDGPGTANLTAAQMSDRQFREWVKAKADLHGVRMIVPTGRVGLETRVYLLNRLRLAGIRIYMLPEDEPQA